MPPSALTSSATQAIFLAKWITIVIPMASGSAPPAPFFFGRSTVWSRNRADATISGFFDPLRAEP